jgi:mono/diheme cytochrome c family protein
MTCLNAVQRELHCRGFRHPTTVPAELKRIVTGLTQWDDRTVLIVEGAAAARNYLTALMGHASATGAKLIFASDHNQLVKREIGFSGELFCRSPRSAPVAPPTEACFLLDLKAGLVLMAVLGSSPTALAAGDSSAGQTVFATHCVACHSTQPGKNEVGPSLASIVGSKSARFQGTISPRQ